MNFGRAIAKNISCGVLHERRHGNVIIIVKQRCHFLEVLADKIELGVLVQLFALLLEALERERIDEHGAEHVNKHTHLPAVALNAATHKRQTHVMQICAAHCRIVMCNNVGTFELLQRPPSPHFDFAVATAHLWPVTRQHDDTLAVLPRRDVTVAFKLANGGTCKRLMCDFHRANADESLRNSARTRAFMRAQGRRARARSPAALRATSPSLRACIPCSGCG